MWIVFAVVATIAVTTLITAGRAEAFIYWVTDHHPLHNDWELGSSIGRANLDGSGANPDFIDGIPSAGDLAVDSSHIYWINQGMDPGSIARANLDGSGVELNFIPSGEAHLSGIAVDSSHIYWTHDDESSLYHPCCHIGRANLDGSGVDQEFADFGGLRIAVNSTHIFWTSQTAGAIGRAKIEGTSPDNNFIAGLTQPGALEVTPSYIFFGQHQEGSPASVTSTIGRANLDASGFDPSIVTDLNLPQGLAAIGSEIFWTDRNEGGQIGRAYFSGAGLNRSVVPGAGDPEVGGLDVDSGFSPDVSVSWRVSTAGGRHVGALSVFISCDEPCNIGLSGRTIVGRRPGSGARVRAKAMRRSFKFQRSEFSVKAGEPVVEPLKYQHQKRSLRQLRRLLSKKRFRRGAKATIKIRGADPFGNSTREKLQVKRLKP